MVPAGLVGSWIGWRLSGIRISEAYWVRVQVGSVKRDVLVRLFEHRVLTYTLDEQPMWQVQMGNIGQYTISGTTAVRCHNTSAISGVVG